MIVTIKPHSAFKKFFIGSDFKADLNTYNDINLYIKSMHPGFFNYLIAQKANGLEESFMYLDKNLNELNPNELHIRKPKADEVIHIVPAIIGGGGKRGGLLAILAIATMFVLLPMAAAAAAAGAAAPVGASVAASGGLGGLLASSTMLQTLVMNVGLSLITALFTPKPKAAESTRENDMFGSLTNTTGAGTPVALHYGQVRVAGQLVSGYLATLNHSKTDTIDTYQGIYKDELSSAASAYMGT